MRKVRVADPAVHGHEAAADMEITLPAHPSPQGVAMQLPAQAGGWAHGQQSRDSEPVGRTPIHDHPPDEAPRALIRCARRVRERDEGVVGGRGARGHFIEQAAREARAGNGRAEVEAEEGVGEDGVGVEEAEAEGEAVEGFRGGGGGDGGEGGGERGEGEGVGAAAREEAAAEEVEREVRVRGVRGGGERGEEGVEDGQRDAGRVREHGGQAGCHGRRQRPHWWSCGRGTTNKAGGRGG